MNRTFFGDTRDLFKYDLVRHVMKALPIFSSFAFIPMLSDDAEPDGGKKSAAKDLQKAVRAGRAGSQNKELMDQMERLQEIDDDLEYFQAVKDYFRTEKILVDVLHDHPFTHKKRDDYFGAVLSHFPKKSLIFLDPDVGLEESKPSKKHLLYDEVRSIAGTMDEQSVLMIYQHFPREKREGYVRRRCSALYKATGCCPISITDNEVVFFFMVKNAKLHESLEDVLSRYANSYPVLESGTCE